MDGEGPRPLSADREVTGMSARADPLGDRQKNPSAESAHRPPADAGDGTEAWRMAGLWAGAQGAAAVALFFLAIDLATGRPMWTPSALGARLFQGQALDPSVGWVPVLALGYTLVHGAVFLAIGSIASQVLANMKPVRTPSTMVIAAGLFLAIQATFVGFALLLHPDLLAQMGAGPVALANMVAAIVMAMSLQRGSAR